MTPSSRSVAVLALVLAAVAHAAPAFFQSDEKTEVAGGNTDLATMGNSFANMVAGTQSPEPPHTFTETVQSPEEPQKPTEAPPAEHTRDVHPEQPVEPLADRAQTNKAQPIAVPVQKSHQTELQPLSTQSPMVQQPQNVETAPVLQQTSPNVTPAQQSITAVQPNRQPNQETEKPVEQVAQAPKPAVQSPITKPEPSQNPKPKPKPRGNNTSNAVQGTLSGQNVAQGGQAQNRPNTAKAQGNASASNYAGLVRRKIHRAKRQRVNIKGAARVAFSIAPNGSISGARITRSSGSARLDSIALSQVRRAAPFPPPPSGARTSFTVEIKGK